MSTNRFFTVLIIPEKTSQVRRLVMPTWVVRSLFVVLFFAVALSTIMLLDYWYVMNQLHENKQLKIENRRLRQQVQVFKNKMSTIESTMERVKTFSTRLKVITNIEDRSSLIERLNQKLPDASTNLGLPPQKNETTVLHEEENPETAELRKDYEEIENTLSELNHETLIVEQVLQDQYELLADQKSFLAALPTRKPAVGYITSGFGIRKSPFGGSTKMHEGLDIANYPGTAIKAPADGVVIHAASKSGYGNTLILDHGYGLETLYGHTRKILVNKGQKVRRGDTVALLGNSGRSTGPHLHYEVHIHGIPVDPWSYILESD